MVKAHIADCGACQATLRTMQLLAASTKAELNLDSEGHVSTEILTKYYGNKQSLDEKTITRIEAHLDKCERCSYDLYFLTSLEDELAASVRAELAQPSLLDKIFNFGLSLIRKPAFAYLLLLLTIYPAARWLHQSLLDRQWGDEGFFHGQIYQLSEISRSGGELPVVRRSKENSLAGMAISYYHLLEEYRYEFSFQDEEQTQTYPLEKLSDFSRQGTIRLIVNIAGLSDGSYVVSLYEIDRQDPADTTVHQYPFQLQTE